MLQALDMRTILFTGAMICLTQAGIMVYYSMARRTYPGFHHWTAGYLCVGVGAILLSLRGTLPSFLSIVVANSLVLAMPYLLTRGLTIFLGLREPCRFLYGTSFALFLGAFLWGTYVTPDLNLRIVVFSLMFLLFYGESLWISLRHLPSVLGGEQNWLLIALIAFAIVSSLARILLTVVFTGPWSFMLNPGIGQCLTVMLAFLSMAGIMCALIIVNAHRMERDLGEANRQIEILANQDGLTGLYNRRYMDRKLDQEFKRLQRVGQPISLVMADIDYFKDYNDAYGHQAGDDCLKAVAQAFIASGGRSADVPARYGGEEFVMILPNTDAGGALKVARSIRDMLRDRAIPHMSSKVADTVTLSFGLATMTPDQSSYPDRLVALADQALYTSKTEGRNRISVACG